MAQDTTKQNNTPSGHTDEQSQVAQDTAQAKQRTKRAHR